MIGALSLSSSLFNFMSDGKRRGMEISSDVAIAFASAAMIASLVLSLTVFTALFSLLVGAVSDWILGGAS